eukprot:3772811-Prymnesium_polylepis.1
MTACVILRSIMRISISTSEHGAIVCEICHALALKAPLKSAGCSDVSWGAGARKPRHRWRRVGHWGAAQASQGIVLSSILFFDLQGTFNLCVSHVFEDAGIALFAHEVFN